jgi:hypothetical protein
MHAGLSKRASTFDIMRLAAGALSPGIAPRPGLKQRNKQEYAKALAMVLSDDILLRVEKPEVRRQ